MAIMMHATDDPAAAVGNTVGFNGFTLIGLVVAVLVYRPLFSFAADLGGKGAPS